MQPIRDLPPLSSNDFVEKKDTESDQINADPSTSSKKRRRKRKRETGNNALNQKRRRKRRRKRKRETGNNALNQSDKDQDLPEEVVIAQPKGDLHIQSPHGKCLTQDDEVKNHGQVTVTAQIDLEVAELGSRKDDSLMPGKQSGSADNENTSGFEVVQPNRSLPALSSKDFIEKINTESDHVNADLSISNQKKRKKKKTRKRNKQKSGNKVLDKCDKDQCAPEEVATVQPERDQDAVMNFGLKAGTVQFVSKVAELGSSREDSLVLGKQSIFLNYENTSEVEAVEANGYLCPLSSDIFIKKMDTTGDQVNAELSSSNQRKSKKMKHRRNNVIDELGIIGQEAVCVQSGLEVPELGLRRENSVILENQSDFMKNENTAEVQEMQPIRDLPPLKKSSNDFVEKKDTESDQVNADPSTSSKKRRRKRKRETGNIALNQKRRRKRRRKRKTGNNALNQSDKDKDLPEEVVFAQPIRDLHIQSPHGKYLTQDDEVKNHGLVTVTAQTDLEVAELGSRKDDSLEPGKQSGYVKNENTSGVEAEQPDRDLAPLRSNDFIEKIDTESDQLNADISTLNKPKLGTMILDKSDKDLDLPEEVVIVHPKGDMPLQSLGNKCLKQEDEILNGQESVNVESILEVAELVSGRNISLIPGQQSGSLKNENTLEVEALLSNGDSRPLSSNGSDKKLDTESVQVNKRQKSGNNVLDKVDKDQDLPKDLKVAISDTDKFELGLQCESKLDEIQVMTHGEVDVDKAPVHYGISTSRKKLLILDINGLLADIVPYGNLAYKPDISISRKAVFKRPSCDDFLHFCFERFNVAVWSSRTKRNVNSAINYLMRDCEHKLLFCWDQSHCTRTKFYTLENTSKPLVLKELKKVWEKTERNLPWAKGDYNEANTLLVDDSPYKALRNPAYTAIFPYPYQHSNVKDASLGPGGDLRVYLEGLSKADNVQKYVEENPFGQEAITESNQHWHFYSQIL